MGTNNTKERNSYIGDNTAKIKGPESIYITI
jgi:hypothetical protein